MADAAPVNIITMKWGTLYGPHYVNRLYASVHRNLSREFRFVCFTDDATGVVPSVECHPIADVEFSTTDKDRRWLKLGGFKEGIADLRGTCLFLDLDVVIVDSIDAMFDYEPEAFCISHDWWMPHKHLLANYRIVHR